MHAMKDRRRLPRRAALLALAALLLVSVSARADEAERGEKRQARLAVLAVYTAVAAAAVGGSYLLRDDFVGRGIATTAAAWGGLGVGAGLGWALSAAGGCHEPDCSEAHDTAALAGGLLGAAAGSVAGYFATKHDGMSRVYTTGAGMAPFVLIVGVATIAQW